MKESVLVFSMTLLLLLGGMNMAIAQEQPKLKKDTVNIDTDAKPTFYYAVEDEKSSPKGNSEATIVIIGGIIVVAGVVGFILIKRNKK